jgi:hypothetical protein
MREAFGVTESAITGGGTSPQPNDSSESPMNDTRTSTRTRREVIGGYDYEVTYYEVYNASTGTWSEVVVSRKRVGRA